MGTRWLVLPWLLLVTAGCASHRVPAYTSFGLAWGRDADEAVSAALLVNDAAASVVRHLPGAVLRRFDVVVVDPDGLEHGEAGAVTGMVQEFSGGRLLMHLASVEGDEARQVLLHELVHAFAEDLWKQAPQALEEGLCDYVAALDGPSLGASASARDWARAVLEQQPGGVSTSVLLGADRSVALGSVADQRRSFEDLVELLALPDQILGSTDRRGADARAAAFLVVHRIASREGLAGLRSVAATCRGQSAREWARVLLARAGLRGFCDLVEAAHELTDPQVAEFRARAFAATFGVEGLLDDAGPDPELLIMVDGRHPVVAQRDWFLRSPGG